jgi:hypothetical protein
LDACPACAGDKSDNSKINGCPLNDDGTISHRGLMICKFTSRG